MNKAAQQANLFHKIARLLKSHPIEKVENHLSKLESWDDDRLKQEEMKDYIIDLVCTHYSSSLDRLIEDNIRGIDVEARDMCYILLKHHLKWSHQRIAENFKRNGHSTVSIAIKRYSEANPKFKQDREFLDLYEEFTSKIKTLQNH